GPAVVQMIAADGTRLPPVLMQVDPPPPIITAAVNNSGAAVDGSHPAKTNDTVTLTVVGFLDSFNRVPAASSVVVSVGGVNVGASAVTAGTNGACLVQFALPAGIANGATQVTVGVDTRVSGNYSISVQN